MSEIIVKTKYDYYVGYNDANIDYSKIVTVPDQVLSMRDIYNKFAVTGEIAGLSQGRIGIYDEVDIDDPAVVIDYDDDLDVLAHSREIRRNAEDAAAAASSTKSNQKPTDPEPSEQSVSVNENEVIEGEGQ